MLPVLSARAARLRCLSTSASGAPPLPLVLSSHARPGVALLQMNNPQKLNGWTAPMLLALRASLAAAAADPQVATVVLTGSDPYYCAGVNLGGLLRPMSPRTLREFLRSSNESLFDTFLAFPKPLLAAVNGPAIGASVTSATLCDALFASERATFSTPFAALGIPPEGCSSVLFPRRLGAAAAARMLQENWRPTAAEALAIGLVQRVLPHAALLPAALDEAEAWARQGRRRTFVEDPALLAEMRAVNAGESERLADAFLAPPFLEAQRAFSASKGRHATASAFWALNATRPIWKLLL